VVILSGPFAGLTGVFAMARGEERVAVLVELLGRQNRIEIARDALSEPM
jgi:transcriptional antiterminator RfaH